MRHIKFLKRVPAGYSIIFLTETGRELRIKIFLSFKRRKTLVIRIYEQLFENTEAQKLLKK